MLVVEAIHHKKDIAAFIDFTYDLYKGDPNFVPELFIAQRDHMDPKKNPYFEHAKAQLFLAKRDGNIVGRIAAVRDDKMINFTKEPIGVFGFFDFVDDAEVPKALLDKAVQWIKNEKLSILEGPYNFSVNHTCGLLIEGFNHPPTVMMTYNKPYYQQHLENYGLKKKTDLLAYYLDSEYFPKRLQQSTELLKKRLEGKGIRFRKIDLKNFKKDVLSTLHVYNEAWTKNLGYTPMSEAEFLHAAKDMKLIMDPELVLLAEKDNQVIGFSLTLPDINEIQITIKRGRLFPFGIFKLLLNKKKIKGVRVIALGVLEEYRKLGIDSYLYCRAFEYMQKHPILKYGEASWILENNPEMNQAILKMGGKEQKKYRLFRMNLI